MAESLLQTLSRDFKVKIDNNFVKHVRNQLLSFEFSAMNMPALNTPYVGVHKAHFLNKDTNALFDISGIDINQFRRSMYQNPYIRKDRNITGDPYNVLTVWLTHLADNSDLSVKNKTQVKSDLMRLMQYRFFTSLVPRRFKHGAKESIMKYTLDNMSGKFGIKDPETPTWRLMIKKRADELATESIHQQTLKKFGPDKKIVYVMSDTQTRLRNTLNRITRQYYDNHDKQNEISNTSIVGEIDGEKNLAAITNSFDNTIITVCNDALNINKFISQEILQLIHKATDIRTDNLKDMLLAFSDVAVQQSRQGKGYSTVKKAEYMQFEGYKSIITEIIQKTIRQVILDKEIDVRYKSQILKKALDLYTSSRITDQDIINIKRSVADFVEKHSRHSREATNVKLRVSFTLYIIMLSFRAMG